MPGRIANSHPHVFCSLLRHIVPIQKEEDAEKGSFLLGMVNEAYREAFRKQLEDARAKYGENPTAEVIDLKPLKPVNGHAKRKTERDNWPDGSS